MKKRLLVFGLVLALAMSAIMPAPVFAADEERTEFAAAGMAYVTDAGTIMSYGFDNKNQYRYFKEGETIQGQIIESDWADFIGAEFEIVEDCDTQMDYKTGKLMSTADGEITVAAADGSVFVGRIYNAVMHGDFTAIDAETIIFNNVDYHGQIELEGVSGNLEGTAVRGTVSATFEFVEEMGTLVGEVSIKGTY